MPFPLFGSPPAFRVRWEWADPPEGAEEGDTCVVLKHVDCPSSPHAGGGINLRRGAPRVDDGKLRLVCSLCRMSSPPYRFGTDELLAQIGRAVDSGDKELLLTEEPVWLVPSEGGKGVVARWIARWREWRSG